MHTLLVCTSFYFSVNEVLTCQWFQLHSSRLVDPTCKSDKIKIWRWLINCKFMYRNRNALYILSNGEKTNNNLTFDLSLLLWYSIEDDYFDVHRKLSKFKWQNKKMHHCSVILTCLLANISNTASLSSSSASIRINSSLASPIRSLSLLSTTKIRPCVATEIQNKSLWHNWIIRAPNCASGWNYYCRRIILTCVFWK